MKIPNPRFLRFLPILAFALALPSASLAQSEGAATDQPPLPWEGDIWTRERLTGDWGGARTSLSKNYGIDIQADVTQYYQGVTSGGLDDNGEWEYSGTSDYRLHLDTGKAGLWPRGFLDVHGESYWGDVANAFTGAVLPSNFDLTLSGIPANGTYLSHLTFTQFLSERFAITGGKVDTSLGDANDYAHGTGDQQFMNAAFALNPTTYQSSPYSVLGAGFVYLLGADKQSQLGVLVYDGDGVIDDAGFDTAFEGRTTLGGSLRLKTDFFGMKGHQFFGFIYGFGKYSAQTEDPRVLLPSPPPGTPDLSVEGTWTGFYNFDQQLFADPDNPARDIGVFGRFGIADKDSSVISTFWSLGLGGKGLLPSRVQDSFGVGYYYMTFIDDRVKQVLPSDDEQGVEVFYTLAVTPGFKLSVDLQVIEGALSGADTAVVGGFRSRISF